MFSEKHVMERARPHARIDSVVICPGFYPGVTEKRGRVGVPGGREVDRSTGATNAILDGMPPRARSKYGKMTWRVSRSFTAAVKLKCLECSCWSYPEVQLCEVRRCPLYDMRTRLFRVKARKAKGVSEAA
jgi:hypothetical protein